MLNVKLKKKRRWRHAEAARQRDPAASRKLFKAIEALEPEAGAAALPLLCESTCALIVCGKGSSSIVLEFVWSAKKITKNLIGTQNSRVCYKIPSGFSLDLFL